MKFALNGAVTIGTLDGANIEIRERVGAENFFLFGLTAEEVLALKAGGYSPVQEYLPQPRAESRHRCRSPPAYFLRRRHRACSARSSTACSSAMPTCSWPTTPPSSHCQDEVERAYRDPEAWTRMSILNTARCGFFSSDRAVRQYCEDIWKIKPLKG